MRLMVNVMIEVEKRMVDGNHGVIKKAVFCIFFFWIFRNFIQLRAIISFSHVEFFSDCICVFCFCSVLLKTDATHFLCFWFKQSLPQGIDTVAVEDGQRGRKIYLMVLYHSNVI